MVGFIMPLAKDTASVNALLPLILKHSCGEYPDMTAMKRRLKQLYGARLDGTVSKRGDYQVVTLYCECLDNGYAFGGEKVLESCAELLKSVIFDPALENGAFKKADVYIEKRNLIDQIDSVLNDKRQYALVRLKSKMCSDEPFGIFELGDREDAKGITPEKLYSAWKNMLSCAKVEIVAAGAGEFSYAEKLFADAFKNVRRGQLTAIKPCASKNKGKVRTFTERLPVTQAKLIMGFNAAAAAPENTDALKLAVSVLGGSPRSKLFMNVREKMSLCYYCISYIESQKGIVFVDSGIEESNYEKARDEILRQVELLKSGDFTEDDLKNAKLYLKNSFMQIEDSLDAAALYYFLQPFTGDSRSPREKAESIMSLSREEIIKAGQGINLNSVYLLAGNKEGK